MVCRQQITTLIDGWEIGISILVVRGEKEGKTLIVCAGIHGDEYEGAVAIQECFRDLDPTQVRGTLIGVSIVNEPAFRAHRWESPIDEKDLARVFPGQPDGTVSEQVAYHLTHCVLKHGDLFIDLHSAGTDYTLKPWVGYAMKPVRIQQIPREAAIVFGLDLIWNSPILPGRSSSGSYLYESCMLKNARGWCLLPRRRRVAEGGHSEFDVLSRAPQGDFSTRKATLLLREQSG